MNDLNKERIKFNTEIIKLLTLLFIATGGGGLALIVEGLGTPTKLILGVVGTSFAFVTGALAIAVYKNTLKKLES